LNICGPVDIIDTLSALLTVDTDNYHATKPSLKTKIKKKQGIKKKKKCIKGKRKETINQTKPETRTN